MCLACADAWLPYAVIERVALFLQFSSKLLVEVFVLGNNTKDDSSMNHCSFKLCTSALAGTNTRKYSFMMLKVDSTQSV
jgi:hypothetical protein